MCFGEYRDSFRNKLTKQTLWDNQLRSFPNVKYDKCSEPKAEIGVVFLVTFLVFVFQTRSTT